MTDSPREVPIIKELSLVIYNEETVLNARSDVVVL